MILRDKIEVIEGRRVEDEYGDVTTDWTVPVVKASLAAQVDYRSTSVDMSSGRFNVTEQLVAIVARWSGFNVKTQRIRWRGRQYRPDGAERTVTAAGRIHHIEVPLIYVTG